MPFFGFEGLGVKEYMKCWELITTLVGIRKTYMGSVGVE